MDLNDILYIIDGTLEVSRLETNGPDGDPIYLAVLMDNTHEPCVVKYPDGVAPRVEASATCWYTPEAACEALVRILAGGLLGYDFPLMWTTATNWVRIPPTLVTGTPTISKRREKEEQ